MDFEALIKKVNEEYKRQKIAVIHKVPTEFMPIRNKFGKIASCKVDNKSCCDFIGRYKGYPIAIEAKRISTDRMPFNEVQPHQAEFLEEYADDEHSISAVIVSYSMERFLIVPWYFWKKALENNGEKEIETEWHGMKWIVPKRKSIKYEEALPEWIIEPTTDNILPYLEKIDKWLSK